MDYDLKELQQVQLSILNELKRVCDKNGIKFYLAYGTCLGALRHNGFIPWDDDIDVLMPYEDTVKLLKCREQIGEGFFLQSNETDKGFFHTILRLRKNGTACVESDDLDMNCHHGIYIDIYPLYNYPDSKLQRFRVCYDSLMYQLILSDRAPKNHGGAVRFIGNFILLFYKNQKIKAAKINRLVKHMTSFRNTKRVADLYGMDLTLTRVISYDSAWFGEPSLHMFEGLEMPLPTDPYSYMKERYGGDFMEMPPVEKQQSYHRYALVDMEKEYRPEK